MLAPLSLLVIIASSLATPAAGATRTLTFGAVADTTVRADRPTKSYGTLTTVTADSSPIEHSLLRFTVSGVGTDVVTGATLRLYVKDASPVGGSVYRVASQTWPENVTWNTAPAADASPLATVGNASLNTWVSFNVLPMISGDGTFSMRITSTSTNGVNYASRENSTTTQRPQLVVTTSTPPDRTPPTVSITAPTDGATVSGPVTIAASASDANGVSSVSFSLDGAPLATDTTAPFTASWDTTTATNDRHTLTATATDPSGNVGTATAVGVTVANTIDATAPTVTVTAPVESATVSG